MMCLRFLCTVCVMLRSNLSSSLHFYGIVMHESYFEFSAELGVTSIEVCFNLVAFHLVTF